ncbi:MAG: type II toxin-antitoxin system Phd/YefM family antitoxin [Alphaproteobacteria bacterium]|nr:type II toxin-antitoxin system Phd/YefM family antitoxin [Alphaproteobacteria bacterium]
MPSASRIKPISYFKANAAEIIDEMRRGAEPMIITQNGEATAIVQDIHSWEKTQEALAMLKILALGKAEAAAGRVEPAQQAMANARKRLLRRKAPR